MIMGMYRVSVRHPQYKTAHKMPTIKSLKSEIGD